MSSDSRLQKALTTQWRDLKKLKNLNSKKSKAKVFNCKLSRAGFKWIEIKVNVNLALEVQKAARDQRDKKKTKKIKKKIKRKSKKNQKKGKAKKEKKEPTSEHSNVVKKGREKRHVHPSWNNPPSPPISYLFTTHFWNYVYTFSTIHFVSSNPQHHTIFNKRTALNDCVVTSKRIIPFYYFVLEFGSAQWTPLELNLPVWEIIVQIN